MSKSMKTNQLPARRSVRILVLASILTLAAAGCTTNQTLTSGEPISLSPTGGPLVPISSTTPGTAVQAVPSTMISTAVDPSVDAVAVLEANRGFEGRVLGPAAPGAGAAVTQQLTAGPVVPNVANVSTAPSISMTGDGRPMVFRGVDVATGGVSAVASSGVTGVSTTTATGIAGATVAPIAPLATSPSAPAANPATNVTTTGVTAGVTTPATNLSSRPAAGR